jgi:hypothetical protein
MSTMTIQQQIVRPRKLLKARVARAVVLAEFGCRLGDWCVTRRTPDAVKACRVFAYIAKSLGLGYAEIGELCVWSDDSVRGAIKYMGEHPSLRLRAEVLRELVEEHLR